MNANSKKVEISKVEKSNVKNDNAKVIAKSFEVISDSDLLERLNDVNITSLIEKANIKKLDTKGNKDLMYNLLGFNEYFKTDSTKIEKSERTKIRKELQKIVNNSIIYSERKEIENLKKEINNFFSFYKAIYLVNDFSLNSLCCKNSDEKRKSDISLFLRIIGK